MKALLLLAIFLSSLFAHSINESLLNIHATVVPKLSLMDYQFKQKLDNNSISIIIYYDSIDYKDARKLKDKIDIKYSDGLKGHPVNTKLITYTQKDSLRANIYYLFPSNKQNIKKTLKKANDNNAMTFSYSSDALSDGCMISLDIGTKVKPIINLDAIKSNDISIRPVLLDISNIYYSKNLDLLDMFSLFNINYAA